MPVKNARGVGYVANSMTLAITTDEDVRLWDTASGRALAPLGFAKGVVAFSADGKRLATAAGSQEVHVWDAATGQELARFQGHKGIIGSLAFAPDGTMLVSDSGDSGALIWDLARMGLAKTKKRQVT